MQLKRILVSLPEPDFEKLVAVAARETRDPDQQAAHYIRRTLSRLPKPKEEPVT